VRKSLIPSRYLLRKLAKQPIAPLEAPIGRVVAWALTNNPLGCSELVARHTWESNKRMTISNAPTRASTQELTANKPPCAVSPGKSCASQHLD